MAIAKAGLAPLSDLGSFLKPFAALLRRSESRQIFERYLTGLLADLPRKTASDIGRALPGTNGQRLQELLTKTSWEASEMNGMRVATMLNRASVGNGVVIIDDTGLPKKGRHSVGVARQYSGTLGRVDNCQVVVTAHYVDAVFDWPVNARLYLPQEWAEDMERRRKAQVPESMVFQTKGHIGLDLIDTAVKDGLSPHAVVADAGYGDQPDFLDGMETRATPYLVGVPSSWRGRLARLVDADAGDEQAPAYSGRGRPKKTPTMKDRVPTTTAKEILDTLAQDAWQKIAWREGKKGALVKMFTCVRVYRTRIRGEHHPSSGWLIGERPVPGHKGDCKQYFAWGLDELRLEELVDLAHVRWIIERFYEDAKGEVGLDHYEGRRWQGLHRHIALVMLAHSFIGLRQSYGTAPSARGAPKESHTDKSKSTPQVRGFPPNRPPKLCSAQTMYT